MFIDCTSKFAKNSLKYNLLHHYTCRDISVDPGKHTESALHESKQHCNMLLTVFQGLLCFPFCSLSSQENKKYRPEPSRDCKGAGVSPGCSFTPGNW